MRPLLLQRLKQETLIQHESLERHLNLLRPGISLADYRNLLEGFYGFYSSWERRAIPLLQEALPGFFDERRKTPLLERDLRFLGSNPAAIESCSALPSADSLSSLLGSLYVLEGATLGGQILTQHFARQLNVFPGRGCSFFFSYGPEVGRCWRSFCQILNSYSSPENDMVIVKSAIQTFSCLENWLRQEVALPC